MLSLLATSAWSANLSYSISGVSGKLKRNVEAWLGEPPTTEAERNNFVFLAESRVDKALQALGYYRPVVSIAVDRGNAKWSMTVDIQQGPPVRITSLDIQIEGDASDDAAFEKLKQDPGIKIGDILNHGHYETLRTNLLNLAQRRGYFDAELAKSSVEVDVGEDLAAVVLVLDSGSRYNFGQLQFDSDLINQRTLDELATFRQGDPYLQSQLRDFQAQLQATGYFAAVLVEPVPTRAEDGEVPVEISLQAAPRQSFDVGIGYSTDTEGRASVTWRTPRINRFGHSQQTRLVYSQVNPSGRITYNIPLTHPINDILQLWARSEENEFGDIDSQQDELGLRRELRRNSWVYGYGMRDLKESWDLVNVNRTNNYLLPGVTLSNRFYKGSLVDPTSGFNQLYTLEGANSSLGSDVDLLRATVSWRYIVTPWHRHRLVGRTDLGFADISEDDRQELAPSLNFFAGGNQSIRGFGYQSIGNRIDVIEPDGEERTLVVGGDRLLVLSGEYQYYFTKVWRGALFVDAGDAFDAGEFDWNVGTGFGIHYISPVGAIRLELARDASENDPDWRLHFNIGAEF